MQSVEQKASQRAVSVLLLSLGLAFGSAALTSEGASAVVCILLGIVIVATVVSGLYRRPLGWLNRTGGRGLARFLGVFLPLGGALLFILYPLAVGFVATAGADVRTNFAIVAVISGVIAPANLGVLILNTVDLLRSRRALG
ncbi:MAG TPA: hypothetical protein VJK02_01625 [Anaerolineales bacterium]|nr:hypothetical protein [Anaerolineales bacterium]